LRAAALYLAHSLLPLGGALHESWRLPPPVPRADPYWNEELDELPFGLFYRPSVMIGQMHLASAAVRLPVALQRMIEAHSGAEASFGELWDVPAHDALAAPDWRRPKMTKSFSTIMALGHCLSSPLGGTEEERLQRAITIVMVVRDDYAHGEEGYGPAGTYKATRKDVVDSLHTCRVVEAQQVLIAWAIERLG
jgi:hypothetical protein